MFENLKIKTRLAILIGVIILSLMGILFLNTISFDTTKQMLNNVYYGGVDSIQLINNIRYQYIQNFLETTYQVHDGKISIPQALDTIKEGKTKISDFWATYLKDLKNESNIANSNSALLDSISRQMNEIASAVDKYQGLLKQEDKEANAKFGTQDFQLLIPSIIKDLHKLASLHAEETLNDYQNGISSVSLLRDYSLLIILGTSILVIGLAIWIALDITQALKKAVGIIKKLTLGDLSFQIDHCSQNETGQLLEAMKLLGISNKKMSDALTSISNGDLSISVEARSDQDTLGLALVNMIQNLRHIIGEIQGEVTNLTTSSQEIVASVAQVATSSAETAAAITETTTSVEELKQTAHVNDEKAQDVLSSSEETLQIVNTSENLLQDTVKNMNQISEKMQIISEGIVKLSEHSQTIGNIVDSVNDLAEQSNLLAVNAAIEAAKAGEHGKSFAVVAQEIRTLAEQSKAATIQIRSILHEIQNSTSSAVLATEQGAKAVENGVKQSLQTSESMQTLSLSVTRVTQAANQIAISSQQQFIGVDQVTVAMSNITDATTQLVDHMKQIESALGSLNSIGVNLKEMTDQYSLPNEGKPLLAKSKQTANMK